MEGAIEKDVNGYLNYKNGKAVFVDQNGDDFYTTNISTFNKDIKGKVDSDGNVVQDHSDYVKSVTAELGHRLDNKNRYVHYLGKYESISKDEASNLAQNYNAMSTADKTKFVSNLTREAGITEGKNILSQMFVQNPSAEIMSASIYSYGSISDKATVNTMNRGFKTLNEQNKKGGMTYLKTSAQKQLKSTILSKLTPYIAGQSAEMTPINVKSVQAYYYGKATFDDDESIDSAVIDKAITSIYGVKGEFEGHPVFIPEGKDDGWLELTMRNVESDNRQFFESQDMELPINGYTGKPYNNFDEVRRVVRDMGFHLESLGRGKYRYVNNLGFPIKNKNGSSFRFDLYVDNEDPKGPMKLYGDK